MNIAQIEEKLNILTSSFNKENFIYDFLLTYGLPKASITRLKKGNLNLSKEENEISWKKKLYFREENEKDLHVTLSEIESNLSHKQRFVIVTDYKTWLAADTKTGDKLDIPFNDLPQYYDFFLPWAGMEKTQHQNENPADVKAAEKMAKLFDEIKKDNPQDDPEFIADLNVFLSRLLFCFFAEDTNIFGDNQFTNALASHTKEDGRDLHKFFDQLFDVLNTAKRKRGKLAAWLNAFPYVNGGLFERSIDAPTFTRKSRQAIIAAGELNWKDINPDIFGSMFQAVIGVEQRGSLGQHYTSVPNIMKVIEPLFLNDLYEEYEKAGDNSKKLNALLNRIAKLKIFDPACGSGNFLIIAYKELRRLEIKIFQKLNIGIPFSAISLTQFYGIEIDPFAVEIAQLSLWLAEHQMNVEFFQAFGKTNPTLPLKQAGHIVCANACRIDWEEVCPKDDESASAERSRSARTEPSRSARTERSRSASTERSRSEIYILGNPPYLGGKSQSIEQKRDVEINFQEFGSKFKELDYIACWFIKAAKYITKSKDRIAFVTTSSICEGAQVEQLWPIVERLGVEIHFAFKPFNWTNNARSKAGVTVTIIGLQKTQDGIKFFISKKGVTSQEKINGYLINYKNLYVTKKNKPFANLPIMITGNSPYEGGNLMLLPEQKDYFIHNYPISSKIIRKALGARELTQGIDRFCFWISDSDLEIANSIPEVKDRIEKIYELRQKGGDVARGLANRPHQFRYTHTGETSIIVVPIVSSSRRTYIPIGLVDKKTIILSSAAAIYNCEPYVFSIVSSRIHMRWVKLIAGKLRGDVRYLTALCYNTFPFPQMSKTSKEELTTHTFRILEEREKHPEKTLAQLYDPDKMPDGLREAHRLNDLAVERCYRSKPFESDEERLEYLFKLYEQMIQEEKDRDTLFQKEKKTRKKRE